MAEQQDAYFTIRISLTQKAEFEKLAKENDRSLSAEMRRAIREYLAAHKAAA